MTNESRTVLDALAALLEYPGEDWRARLEECPRLLDARGGEPAERVAAFGRAVVDLCVSELQELYTRTFDLNPVCAPEVGYHLFGDTYKRGVFLARLREAEEPYAVGQGRQLPDFLPVMLRFAARLNDVELSAALLGDCMIPAAEKMTDALEKAASPYVELMRAIAAVLRRESNADAPECCASECCATEREAAAFGAAVV